MKKNITILTGLMLTFLSGAFAQSVGIGTTSPIPDALFHVELGTSTTKGILVTGTYNVASTVPDLGAGSRFMFYPGKVAFRVGYTNATQWDNSNVGQFSTAMGYGTTASGYVSTAFGRFTNANNSYATAMGYTSIASGPLSTALGAFTTASGASSTAMGVNTIASAQSATAMGENTTASGYAATALGYFTKAKGYASTVLGMYNDSIVSVNEASPSSSTPLFIVGNGSTNENRSNAMIILKSGSVGIGSTTMLGSAQLHVEIQPGISKGFLVTGTADQSTNFPDLGAGTRLMFYPGRAAFRAGYSGPANWTNANVGQYSVAMGFANKASGQFSFATGNNVEAVGEGSFASGEFTHAIGQSSTAMGRVNSAIGASSTAMGGGTKARGWYSTTMGNNTISKGYASTVVGMYNDSLLIADQNSVSNSTPLFIVGNGDYDDRSNAMVVLKSGYVGIGDNTPTNPLSFPPVLGKKISLYPGGTGDVGFAVQGNQLLIYSDNPNASVRLGYDQAGVFTNNLDVYGNGNAWLRGTLTQNSDARLKKDITHIQNALPLMMQLSGYTYYWKNETMDQALQSGVIAQQVQKIFPQLVKEDAEGTLSVNYTGLIPYMIEAAKTQQEQMDELKNENAELKTRLEKVEKIMANLKL